MDMSNFLLSHLEESSHLLDQFHHQWDHCQYLHSLHMVHHLCLLQIKVLVLLAILIWGLHLLMTNIQILPCFLIMVLAITALLQICIIIEMIIIIKYMIIIWEDKKIMEIICLIQPKKIEIIINNKIMMVIM